MDTLRDCIDALIFWHRLRDSRHESIAKRRIQSYLDAAEPTLLPERPLWAKSKPRGPLQTTAPKGRTWSAGILPISTTVCQSESATPEHRKRPRDHVRTLPR